MRRLKNTILISSILLMLSACGDDDTVTAPTEDPEETSPPKISVRSAYKQSGTDFVVRISMENYI